MVKAKKRKVADSWLDYKWDQAHTDKEIHELYRMVFGNDNGRKLLFYWLDSFVLNNPHSFDPHQALAYASVVAFIQDIIKAVDMSEQPGKYEQRQETQADFDPRYPTKGGPLGPN